MLRGTVRRRLARRARGSRGHLVERRDRSGVATFYADAPLAPGASRRARRRGRAARASEARQVGDPCARHQRPRLDRRGNAGAPDERVGGRRSTYGERTIAAPPSSAPLRPGRRSRSNALARREERGARGESTWQPVLFRRSRASRRAGQGDAFTRKVRARMIGALEQSGGAWLPEICSELSLEEALVRAERDRRRTVSCSSAAALDSVTRPSTRRRRA